MTEILKGATAKGAHGADLELTERVQTLLADIEAERPQAKESMFAALSHVRATHLLDRDLWTRLDLGPDEPTSTPRGRGRLKVAG